jgi:hypothetical protein
MNAIVAERPAAPPRLGAWSWQSTVYVCLALIPIVAIPLPIPAQGGGYEHAGFTDIAGLPIILLLLARGRLPRSYVWGLTVAFLLCAVLSIFSAAGAQAREVVRVYRLCAMYAPFLLALSLPWTVERMHTALKVFWWSGLLGCLIGLGVYWLVGPVREHEQELFTSTGVVYRAGGVLGNSGGFSHLITGWAMAAICLHWIALGRLRWWQLLATFVVLIYGIVVTASRSSLLQAGTGVLFALVFVVRSGRSNVPRVMAISLAGLAFVAALVPLMSLVVSPSFFQAVLARFGLGDDPGQLVQTNRFEHWAELLNAVDWNAFGIGYKRTTDLTGLQVDNSYLRIVLELGVPGILCYLLLWFCIESNLLAGSPDRLVRRLKAAAAGMALGELARMFFSDTFTMYLSAPNFLVILAIMLRLRAGPAPPGRSDGAASHHG